MPKTIRPLLAAVAIFLFPGFCAFAQVADFRTEKPYLHEQKDRYQHWLEYSGIGDILRVYDLTVEERDVVLFLGFTRPAGTDYMINAWETLKFSFEAEHPIRLEQALFYKWISLSGISQDANVGVYVYNTYEPGLPKLFGRQIYFDADSGKVMVEEYNPKSMVRKIEITPPTFSDKKISEAEIRKQWSKKVVFDKIYAYAKNRYEQTRCDQRFPQVKPPLEDDDVLRFEVIDLCKEVLVDESQNALCELFRSLSISDCNWVKREMLTFTITHEETVSGVKITVDIEGKYGSGFYSNLSGLRGYMDMEEEFKSYLERYADQFKTELKKILTE
ncbi:MAG: hypothetical protein R3D00_07785 [Bacteroidia bacterium]